MKFRVKIHSAEEGGFWAEIPAIPGCATQGETYNELLSNIREAVEGCLSVDDRRFWKDVSEFSLNKIWHNLDDDIYQRLLEE